MIGVNTAVIMGAQGICFSVASNTAQHVLTQVLQHGRVRRARLGIAGDQVHLPQRLRVRSGLTQESGVRVVEVQAGSPAMAGGLEPGDVIVGLDAEAVTGIDDIARILDGSAHRQAGFDPHPARGAPGDGRHRPHGAPARAVTTARLPLDHGEREPALTAPAAGPRPAARRRGRA